MSATQTMGQIGSMGPIARMPVDGLSAVMGAVLPSKPNAMGFRSNAMAPRNQRNVGNPHVEVSRE